MKEKVIAELAQKFIGDVGGVTSSTMIRVLTEFGGPLWDAAIEEAAKADWLSATERLPRPGEWCWVVCGHKVQRMAAHLAGKGFACEDGYEWVWADADADHAPLEAVTHWRPLPTPPSAS